MIKYPQIVTILQQERPFRRAVLHGLCYYTNQEADRMRDVNHTYNIGYYTGWLTAGYAIRYHQHPSVSYRDLVLEEVRRLTKELKSNETID